MAYTQYTFDLGEYTAYEIKFVGRNGAKGEKRAKRQKATPEQMSRQNQWNKEKNTRYVILANFHTGDAWTTLKYPRGMRPDADRMRADWKKIQTSNDCILQEAWHPIQVGEENGDRKAWRTAYTSPGKPYRQHRPCDQGDVAENNRGFVDKRTQLREYSSV